MEASIDNPTPPRYLQREAARRNADTLFTGRQQRVAQAKQEAEPSKHEALLAAFRRLDEPLPPRLRPIDPAAKYLTPEQLREQHSDVAAILLPPSDD